MSIRQVAFDIVERIADCASPDLVVAELRRAAGVFGFDNFSICGMPPPGESAEPYVILSGWPQAWMTRYLEQDYIHVDPVCRRLLSNTMPFGWGEATYERDDRAAVQVMSEAPSFGLADGFAVPIYTTHGFSAGVTFGRDRPLELDPEHRAALHLVAIYAHNAARGAVQERPKRQGPRLSPREVECLRWASAGKSAWETSMVLSLAESTVIGYLASATRKLDAVTKTQAVAEALRRRIIS